MGTSSQNNLSDPVCGKACGQQVGAALLAPPAPPTEVPRVTIGQPFRSLLPASPPAAKGTRPLSWSTEFKNRLSALYSGVRHPSSTLTPFPSPPCKQHKTQLVVFSDPQNLSGPHSHDVSDSSHHRTHTDVTHSTILDGCKRGKVSRPPGYGVRDWDWRSKSESRLVMG